MIVETLQHQKNKCCPVTLKLHQPRKRLSCCEYFPDEIPTKLNRSLIIIVPYYIHIVYLL